MMEWHFEASHGKRHTKLLLFLPNTCGNVTRYLRPEGFHLV
jgi:hypothetical protein